MKAFHVNDYNLISWAIHSSVLALMTEEKLYIVVAVVIIGRALKEFV